MDFFDAGKLRGQERKMSDAAAARTNEARADQGRKKVSSAV